MIGTGFELPKRTNLTLPDEPLPLTDDVLKSLRDATRVMGKDNTARLVSDLLEKIASDGLYKAVLLTGKMTCGGSGPGAVRLTKRPRLSRGGVISRSP